MLAGPPRPPYNSVMSLVRSRVGARVAWLASLGALASSAGCLFHPAPPGPCGSNLPCVLIATSLGNILATVDTTHAPVTSENFLHYVDDGYYNGGLFFRAL